jgi:hypothetical protein
VPEPEPVVAEVEAEPPKKPSLADFVEAHARDSKRQGVISALSALCVGGEEQRGEPLGEPMPFTHAPIELTTCLDARGSEEAARIMESVFTKLDSLEKSSGENYDGIISRIMENHPYLETIRVLGSLFNHPHFSDKLLMAFAELMDPNPYCGYRYKLRDLYPPNRPYRWTACGYGGCTSGTDTDLDPLGEQVTLQLQLMQGILQRTDIPAQTFPDIAFVLDDLSSANYERECTKDGYLDALESLRGAFAGESFDARLFAFIVTMAHNGNLYGYLSENGSR